MSDPFWDGMQEAFVGKCPSVDRFLRGEGPPSHAESTRGEDFPAGTRVRFVASLEAALTYQRMPGDGAKGTVVRVRTSHGDVTRWQGRLMVRWDDGSLSQVWPGHLRVLKGKDSRVRRTFRSFQEVTQSYWAQVLSVPITQASEIPTDLVHQATQDIWALRKEGDKYVLERLFDEDGEPLKV